MSNPLHAAYYADAASDFLVEVFENVPIATDTYRLRFRCPEMAASILPGQFLMLRLADCNDPLIGRPLALYDVIEENGAPNAVDVVYFVKGKLTSALQHIGPGAKLNVWGPLGNGFLPRPVEHLVMVAGGIGQTPFLALAKEYLGRAQFGTPFRQINPHSKRVTLCYGARSASLLAGVADFEALGVDLRISTDDGSAGQQGLVTDSLTKVLSEGSMDDRRVVCCGPEPMMEAVTAVCRDAAVPCQVSLETPMACGVGICFSCVAEICDESGESDYKRTCVEGPVFDAECVVW